MERRALGSRGEACFCCLACSCRLLQAQRALRTAHPALGVHAATLAWALCPLPTSRARVCMQLCACTCVCVLPPPPAHPPCGLPTCTLARRSKLDTGVDAAALAWALGSLNYKADAGTAKVRLLVLAWERVDCLSAPNPSRWQGRPLQCSQPERMAGQASRCHGRGGALVASALPTRARAGQVPTPTGAAAAGAACRGMAHSHALHATTTRHHPQPPMSPALLAAAIALYSLRTASPLHSPAHPCPSHLPHLPPCMQLPLPSPHTPASTPHPDPPTHSRPLPSIRLPPLPCTSCSGPAPAGDCICGAGCCAHPHPRACHRRRMGPGRHGSRLQGVLPRQCGVVRA